MIPKGAPVVFDEVPDEGTSDVAAVNRSVLVMSLLFWVSVFGITFVGTLVYNRSDIMAVAEVRAGLSILGAGFCVCLHLILRLTRRSPLPKRAALAACLIVPTVGLFVLAANVMAAAIEADLANKDLEELVYTSIFWTWLFVAWTSAYFAIQYSASAVAEERRAQKMRELAHAAQLRALHHQISPHFLFNTLNSVSSLVLAKQTDEAEDMLANLSTYFRTTLSLDLGDRIPLREEIALQELYLEIERVRFPDLSFVAVATEAAKEAMVPPLILQPIVENAIRHAVARTARATHLELKAEVLGNKLHLSFSDDGGGSGPSPVAGTGTGLRNVRDRLVTLFGSDHSFDARKLGTEGFLVRLSIPAEQIA